MLTSLFAQMFSERRRISEELGVGVDRGRIEGDLRGWRCVKERKEKKYIGNYTYFHKALVKAKSFLA